ncbi:MAG TPA: glycosyltransferase family 2 protein [Acidobacteriota bacterium]|nr:glycosyltransferase family 2 protein [Acidobacteriota bacterium]
MTNAAETLIVMPARNESSHIGSVLSRIRQMYPELPVLVVNDASTDRTSEIARTFAGVSVIDLPFWMGYGGALQSAYKYALAEGFESVVQMDADGQHDPASIRDLLDQLSRADLVLGSRFLNAKSRYPMSAFRRLGCRILSSMALLLTGIAITDPTSGFQALNRKAIEIAAQDYYPLDYPDLDVLILMHRHKMRVFECPVQMHPAEDKLGMHQGLAVCYYGLKMTLSVLVMMLRKS